MSKAQRYKDLIEQIEKDATAINEHYKNNPMTILVGEVDGVWQILDPKRYVVVG